MISYGLETEMEKKAKIKQAKPRKKIEKRIDSAAEKAKIVSAAATKIEAPANMVLDELAQEFFEQIIEEQAKAQWSKHSISLAADMAQSMSLVQKLKAEVESEGYLITNYTERGSTTVKNPLLGEITKHQASIVAMRRSLALHARAQLGDNRQAGKQRAYAKELEEQAQQETEDDLIPGLRLVK